MTCNDTVYGTGRAHDISSIGCDKGQEGRKSAVCQETGKWKLWEDTCIITNIKELLIFSKVGDLGITNQPHQKIFETYSIPYRQILLIHTKSVMLCHQNCEI